MTKPAHSPAAGGILQHFARDNNFRKNKGIHARLVFSFRIAINKERG
ncbi:MAG: hypothetical protein K8S20_15510 [Chloroflexi bacterium]|nr:hypothetical protein [Chloroflexota bacterium]